MVFCVRRMSLAHTASRDPTPIPCLLSLDTIFFQPLIPGKLIGVGCLSSRALLLCQTNRASIATEAVLHIYYRLLFRQREERGRMSASPPQRPLADILRDLLEAMRRYHETTKGADLSQELGLAQAALDKGDEPGMFRQIKQLVFTAHAALLTGEPGIREALPEAEQVLLSAGITLPNFDTSFGDL